jgi:hypothetical protein
MPIAHVLFLCAGLALIAAMFAIAWSTSVDPGAEDRASSSLLESGWLAPAALPPSSPPP